MRSTLDSTTNMDVTSRMNKVAASTTTVLLDFFTGPEFIGAPSAATALTSIPGFRAKISSRATELLQRLRHDYLSGAAGAAPASRFLNKTKSVYEYVRLTLGIRMHGSENLSMFANGLGEDDVTIGQNISFIHEVRLCPYPYLYRDLPFPDILRSQYVTAKCRA